MIKIETLTLGPMANNTYIVYDSSNNDCFIIDPSWDMTAIEIFFKEKKLTPKFIILTHGHFDHSKNLTPLLQKYNIAVYIHKKDTHMLEEIPPNLIKTFTDAFEIKFAKSVAKIIHTPGHSEGSSCVLIENNLFTGDTLFIGQCGRVDLPGSNPEKMYESLIKLTKLNPEFRVYPGHQCGNIPFSTIEKEVQTNPYIKLALKNKLDFIEAMR